MTGSLIPLLRAVAASEIAKAFGTDEGQTPTARAEIAAHPNPRGTPAQGLQPDSLITILQTIRLPDQTSGLAGLTAPRPLALMGDAALAPTTLSPPMASAQPGETPFQTDRPMRPGLAAANGMLARLSGEAQPAPTLSRPATAGDPAPAADMSARMGLPDAPPPVPSAARAALPAAMAEAMSYGAFPFTLGGSGASAAALVIFNAAMSPSWPPPFRLDQTADGAAQIRVAGGQLAQMTPEETAEFLGRMAGIFGFLLVVKKRLSRSLKEEKESILGLFALFGVAMDSLVKGLHLAFDLTAEQQEVLERITVENGGNPSGRGAGRHRLKL